MAREGIVLVTGAGGYIGAAVADRLRRDGTPLRLVSRPGGTAADGRTESACERVFADLRSERGWEAVLADATAVVHLSARTDLRAAEQDPAGDEKLNVDPVRALLRVASERRGPKLIVLFASAATVVGDQHSNPVNETAPDNPISTYDRHKLLCEDLLLDAGRSGVIDPRILRLANVYGYGAESKNSNRGILNLMMREAVQGRPITLYGDGHYVRDFVYIDDVAEAFATAVSPGVPVGGGRFLIASGQGCTLRDAFSLIARETAIALGKTVEIRHVLEPSDMHPIERRNFVGNSDLFRGATGWAPKFSLETGIRSTLSRLVAEQDQRRN